MKISTFSNLFLALSPKPDIIQRPESQIKVAMRKDSKAKKQSKLMYIICAPIRTLVKAKNFYMRGLENCAGQVSYGGGGVSGYTVSQAPLLPRSFSANASSSSDDENFLQLLRTGLANSNNVEKENNNNSAGDSELQRRPMVRQQEARSGMGMRSYSVGLKMGRIDEEMPSTFEDDELNLKADLYPRSRSYAIRRRN